MSEPCWVKTSEVSETSEVRREAMIKHQRRFQALVVRCIPFAEEEAND